jgi:hypothetical protein
LPSAFDYGEGPRVRILFPPAASQERTVVRGFESISLQEGGRCEPDLLDHGYIPDVLGGIEPSLLMPPELVIPPELVAEVTYLTWAAASVLRMVY